MNIPNREPGTVSPLLADSVWTLAEQFEGKLKGVSFELLARGRKLAETLSVPLVSVLIGNGVNDADLELLIKHGADTVLTVQHPALTYFICEPYAEVLCGLIEHFKPAILLAAATSSGRTLMPYTAIKVHTGLTADCTELDIEEGTGNLLQTRPAIGGNIMATIKTPNYRPQLATVRPRSSMPLPMDVLRRGNIERISFDSAPNNRGVQYNRGVQCLGYRREESAGVNLEEAKVIVAGGKGLKKGENFAMICKLAEALEGAVGGSRDAVDRAWISYPHQIGLSGKTVSPEVYIAAGISGAIQHLAGIKTSETIISINIDSEAALHKLADLAIVGDAFQVIPELQKRIENRKLADT